MKSWLSDNYFTLEVWENGSRDDPIGEINNFYDITNGFGVRENPHIDKSEADEKYEDGPEQEGHPNGSYELNYNIQKVQ